MIDQTRPNLFHYATSELSQDAFICWLAAWADPKIKNPDPAFREMGIDFIRSMLAKKSGSTDLVNINSLTIKQQVVARPVDKTRKAKRGRIDILIDVAYTTSVYQSQKAVIIIEDKVDAALTEQLKIYSEAINANEEYRYHEKHYILLKTGYYDTLSNDKEFKPVNREELLNILIKKPVGNQIADDFESYLKRIDERLDNFKKLPIPQDFKSGLPEDKFYLTGFHRWLLRNERSRLNLTNAGYGYVNNPSGGFGGFWWDFEGCRPEGYWSYLQWENDKLCFKIGFSSSFTEAVDWKVRASLIKSNWWNIFITEKEELLLSDKDTKIGKTITITKIDDALCKKADGTLDLELTIVRMVKAQDVLERTRQKMA